MSGSVLSVDTLNIKTFHCIEEKQTSKERENLRFKYNISHGQQHVYILHYYYTYYICQTLTKQ